MFGLGKYVKEKGSGKKGVTPLEYLILAQLFRRELLKKEIIGQYGNELIREINNLFKGTWKAQSGTIYPILRKMERDKGLIEGELKETPLGPIKKIYKLTNKGRKTIKQIIKENYDNEMKFIERYIVFLEPFKNWLATLEDDGEYSGDVGEDIEEEIEEDKNNLGARNNTQSSENEKDSLEATIAKEIEDASAIFNQGGKLKNKENYMDAGTQIFCPRCGKLMSNNAKFCSQCGAPLKSDSN
ncbi:MAG: helix-turn-helix transcriptional regulator [Promethearchaeota archaeon]